MPISREEFEAGRIDPIRQQARATCGFHTIDDAGPCKLCDRIADALRDMARNCITIANRHTYTAASVVAIREHFKLED